MPGGKSLSNNLMEQELKIKIRNRNNAHFYKTLAGAGVADVLVSIIETASRAGANVYHYFNEVQRNSAKVKVNPELWIPWNHEGNLEI
jgi:transposase